MKHAIAALVIYQDHILIGTRSTRNTSLTDKICLPASINKPHENAQETLIRAVYQNTKLLVKPGKILQTYNNAQSTKITLYESYAKHGISRCCGEMENTRWVPRQEALTHLDPLVTQAWNTETKLYVQKY